MAKKYGIELSLPVEVTKSLIEKGIFLSWDFGILRVAKRVDKEMKEELVAHIFNKYKYVWGEDFAIDFFAANNFDIGKFLNGLENIDLVAFVSRY